MKFLFEEYKNSRLLQFTLILFAIISIWWVYMYFSGITEGIGITWFLLVYPIITLFGGVYGLIVARRWGGMKSILGSSIYLFSLGLLAQTLGQYLYNYYQIYLGIEVPYPSIGDWFYFGSVILYIFAVYQLARVAGIRFSLRTMKGRFVAFIVPLLVLLLMYFFMLQGYEADLSDPLLLFLDFGWLVGQAIYLAIAILALMISKDILGGIMRKPIMLLIIALVIQFLADFYFSYEASREVITYYPAGPTDYLYAIGYFVMTIALVSIGNMFYKVQKS